MQLGVHFFKRPAVAHGILAHLQRGGRHTARVGGLGGAEHQTGGDKGVDGFHGGRHVRALGHAIAAVRDQRFGGIQIDFILGGAGQRDIAGDRPNARAALVVFRGGMGFGVFANARAAHFLDFLDGSQIHAVRIVDIAVGIAHGNHLCAQRLRLFAGIDSNIARTGDHNGLPRKGLAVRLQHFLGEIAQAVAGGFLAGKASAVG